MSPILITFNSLLASLLLTAAAPAVDAGPPPASPDRVQLPEGYLEMEPADGGGAPRGSYTTVPADKSEPNADEDLEQEDAIQRAAPRKRDHSAEDACRGERRRFLSRLAEVRHDPPDAVDDPNWSLDPAIQLAIFGRSNVLRQVPGQPRPLPELTWDSELADRYAEYRKCFAKHPAPGGPARQ